MKSEEKMQNEPNVKIGSFIKAVFVLLSEANSAIMAQKSGAEIFQKLSNAL